MFVSPRLLLSLIAIAMSALAQSPVAPGSVSPTRPASATNSAGAVAELAQPSAPLDTPADYLLGGGDQLQIDVPDLAEEYTSDKTFRIDLGGDLGLPFVGHIQAAGLTIGQLEEVVKGSLKRILKDPDVTITVTGFGSQPVSVLGSVNNPGIVQIGGRKHLFDVLSLAGGLSDNAGYQITITRDLKWGAIPLPGSHNDETGQYSIASVSISDLLSPSNTAQNIIVLPNDKISVPQSELVYAVGNVIKPGGFLLNQHASLSALQVVSLAEGFTKTAAPDRARILRVVPGSPSRQEINVNLSELIAGKIKDFQLQPQDILFVPNSRAKSAGFRTLDALTAAAGAGVYAVSRF